MKDRVQSIQELRAIGFLLVFVSHCPIGPFYTSYLGAFGVQIFIFITGFLQAINHDKNIRIPPLQSVSSKFRKLFPLHLFTFVLSVPNSGLFEALHGDGDVVNLLITGIINLSMMQAFVPVNAVYFSFNAVSWYLTLVLVFAVLSRPALKLSSLIYRQFGRGGVCLLYAAELIWCQMVRGLQSSHWLIYINPIIRCLDLLIGMLVGYEYAAKQERPDEKNRNKKMLFLLMCCVIYGMLLYYLFDKGRGRWYLVAAWTPLTLLVFCVFLEKDKRFAVKSLAWLGNLSMELFLFHRLVIGNWKHINSVLGITSEWVRFGICLLASVICALLWKRIHARFSVS